MYFHRMLKEPDEEAENAKSEEDKETDKLIDFILGGTTAVCLLYTARTEFK